MIHSDSPATQDNGATHPVASGPIGSALLAGVATAIVLAIWLGFYFLVFAPRSVP